MFDNEEAYHNKGKTYLNKRKFEKAMKYFDKSLKINPNYYKSWNSKAVVFFRLNMYNEALSCYNRALAIKPDYVLSILNKSNLCMSNLCNYEEAVKCYDQLLQMDKNALKEGIKGTIFDYPNIIADIWNKRGWALFNLEKHKEAIESYRKSLEINPTDLDVLTNKEIAESELKSLKIDCLNCGTENSYVNDFCKRCGSKLNSITENDSKNEKICPKCNYTADNDAFFCPKCGENLEIEKEIILTDINNDSEEKIASISGVGPILAKKAIKLRESKGGFESIEDFILSLNLKPHIANNIIDQITCTPIKSPSKPRFSGRVIDW